MTRHLNYRNSDKWQLRREDHSPARFRSMNVYDLTKARTPKERHDEWSRIRQAISRILRLNAPQPAMSKKQKFGYKKKKSKR